MAGALILGSMVLIVAGFIPLIFMREGLQKAFLLWLGATVMLFGGIYLLEQKALDAGFASLEEQNEASSAGITDAATWVKRRDAIRAKVAAEQRAIDAAAREAEQQKLVTDAKAAGFADVSAYRTAKTKGYSTKRAYDRYLAREAFFRPPTDQRQVIGLIIQAREAYQGASNDLQRGGARSDRKSALCRLMVRRRANGWVGKLTQLTTNGDGFGVVAIEIGDDITVQTWNNAVSDTFHRTLISPTSGMFKRLSELKVGDRVKFSGRFFKHDVDWSSPVSVDG